MFSIADLWDALRRPPEDLDPYLAEHGESAVAEELLRTISYLQDEALKDLECPFDCEYCAE